MVKVLDKRQKIVGKILTDTRAVLTGSHFVYTSGRHGSSYINKDAVYPHTAQARALCAMWAKDFKDAGVDVVVGPQLGAIILANNTADELSKLTKKEILGVPAEKGDIKGEFEFKRGYADLVKGKKVLVVEDIITTGGSVKTVISLIKKTGGKVVGLGVLCNRGNVKPGDIGISKIDSLIDIQMDSWDEKDCKLCKAGIPIDIRVGKGKEFLKNKPKI